MKLIKFFIEPEQRNFADPKPSKFFMPDWYKKSEVSFSGDDGSKLLGLKTCMPFLDSLTSGYMLSTPVNIYVNEEKTDFDHLFRNNDGSLRISWDGPPEFNDFIKERPKESGKNMPRPAGHYPNHLVFKGFWSIKTPRKYSLLMTPPLNRHDLPFTTASGIIDSDKFYAPGNIPFFIRKDFTGVIPKGTPIVQLIPIKRNSWAMVENDPALTESNLIQNFLMRNKETNYKTAFWQRKRFD